MFVYKTTCHMGFNILYYRIYISLPSVSLIHVPNIFISIHAIFCFKWDEEQVQVRDIHLQFLVMKFNPILKLKLMEPKG